MEMNDISVYLGRQRGGRGVIPRPRGKGTGIRGYPTVILAHSSIATDGAGSG